MENRLIFARIATSKVTTQVVDGRSYLVAPVVAIKAGVLNFKLVPATEIEKSWKSWNDVPIPINHPLRNGEKISARTLDMIEKAIVGRFYNAHYEDEKLKGELWIDVEKAKKVGGDALKALEKLQNGEPLEVSTSYFADESDEAGTYNGMEYDGIHYNLRPDHLALLPTDIGACSWQDGCGAPRVNQEGETMPQLRVALREGESYEMRTEALEGAIKEAVIPAGSTDWYIYISDLFENFVVYRVTQPDQETNYFKAPYIIGEDLKATLGEAVLVKRKVEYTALKANVRGTARNPSYKGTESTAWTGPTLAKMIAGYVKHTGGAKPESSLVKELPSAVKTWIANKTLLGDAAADNERDLAFFPVVNPSTNKLNERALRAVLGGRGAQADIPASARDSARVKARSLLESKFGMEAQEQEGFIEKKIIGPLREFVRNLIEVRNMSEKEQMLETLRKNGVELENLEDLNDDTLKWMVEHSVEPNPAPDPNPDPNPNPDPDPNPDPKAQENEELDTRIEERLQEKYADFDKIKAHMQEVAEEADTAKKKLVDALVANEKCTVSKEALEEMKTDVLRQFAANFEPGSYLGVGVPHRDLEAVPAPPAVVLATKEGEST